MKEQRKYVVSVLVVVSLLFMPATVCQSAAYKVLVVFSYGTGYPWVQEIKAGIDSVLAEKAEIRYFYMNTKKNIEGGPQKAEEASAIYKEFQPDGVITVNDNAQSMFAVPFLKDKVKTPVMFCGVNTAPGRYGYPASNVSGVLEQSHIAESIAFVQQLVPTAKRVSFMMKSGHTAKMATSQIKKESNTYSARIVDFKLPTTEQDLVTMAAELKKETDVLFVTSLKGIKDKNGDPLEFLKIMSILTDVFGKPIISTKYPVIQYGGLCGLIASGSQDGSVAAEMLLRAMQGTPVGKIPIVREINSKRIINIDMLKALKIKPNPAALRGAELIRLEKAVD